MGECGVRGGYAEIVNMDPDVMAMLQKSISAKLCPPILGQVRKCKKVIVYMKKSLCKQNIMYIIVFRQFSMNTKIKLC